MWWFKLVIPAMVRNQDEDRPIPGDAGQLAQPT